nr:Hint domain-containing protein [Acetobacter aceti]
MTDYTITSSGTFSDLVNALGGSGSSIASGNTYTVTGNGVIVTIDSSTTENGGTLIVADGATLTYSDSVKKGTAGEINISGGTLYYNNKNAGSTKSINFTNADVGGTVIFPANAAKTDITGYVPGKTIIEIAGTTKQLTATWNSQTGITTIKGSGISFTIDSNAFNIKTDGGTATVGTSDGTKLIICFLAGSMIRTPSGPVAVESLSAGDEIVAYVDGEETIRRITWAGQAHCNVRPGMPNDEAGYPIRVLKDAIAEGVPYKDMLITAEHCLFFDGKFVPARMLVNGRSIFYDKSITSYDYYHVETEQHSVIMADGMLTESYLDTGNRGAFRQNGNVVSIGSSRNLTWDDAGAPLGVSREFVEPLYRQAEARAEASGLAQKEPVVELTDEANLHIVTETGAVIRQAREHNGRVMFMIPTGVKNIRIVSNASRPSDVIGPFVDDRRYFGVAVGEITMFEAGRNHSVTAHLTEKELAGWNTLEWEDTRWTSGDALLPLGERHSNSAALLAIQIKATGPYLCADATDIRSAKRA